MALNSWLSLLMKPVSHSQQSLTRVRSNQRVISLPFQPRPFKSTPRPAIFPPAQIVSGSFTSGRANEPRTATPRPTARTYQVWRRFQRLWRPCLQGHTTGGRWHDADRRNHGVRSHPERRPRRRHAVCRHPERALRPRRPWRCQWRCQRPRSCRQRNRCSGKSHHHRNSCRTGTLF